MTYKVSIFTVKLFTEKAVQTLTESIRLLLTFFWCWVHVWVKCPFCGGTTELNKHFHFFEAKSGSLQTLPGKAVDGSVVAACFLWPNHFTGIPVLLCSRCKSLDMLNFLCLSNLCLRIVNVKSKLAFLYYFLELYDSFYREVHLPFVFIFHSNIVGSILSVWKKLSAHYFAVFNFENALVCYFSRTSLI